MKQEQKTNLPITRNTPSIEPSENEKVLMKCYFLEDCGKEWLCDAKTKMITCAGCCRKLDRERAIVRR